LPGGEIVEKAKYPILDSLPLAVFFLDGDLRFSVVNKDFCEIAGLDAGACVGRLFPEFFIDGERLDATEKLSDLQKGKVPEALFETGTRQVNCKERWFSVRIVAVEEATERMAYVGGLQDISRWKSIEKTNGRLLEELASANRELKEFTSIVSHDLKAPLRSVSSLAGWIRDDFAERLGEEGRENLDLLVDRVRRMYARIEGIVKFSRLTSLREERTEVDLDVLLSDALRRLSLPEGVRIVKESAFPVISCKRARLGEVFMNLLGNAVKAVNGQDGEIRIGVCLEEDHWRFWVKDNGRGIPKEQQDRIFKLFQKVCPEDEGMGIGLTLARKIVELDGGEISVSSAPGEGAVFSFTFPFAEDV
jgi:PAS domain S-box